MKQINEIVYAARLKDRKELHKSSSGGAFTALSNVFLEEGNAVLCSVYNYEKCRLEYKLLFSKEERNKARGSKYFQAVPLNAFKEAIKWLEKNKNKKLLFVGTGCQAEGFRKLCETSRVINRVTVCDIICTGSPSPKVWFEYSKSRGKIKHISFKDKRDGWLRPYAFYKTSFFEHDMSDYVTLFYSDNILRPSCYYCPFTKIERFSDITIGDFWHIEKTMPDFFDNEGTSLVIIHSEKGIKAWNSSQHYMDYRESNTKDCLQNMLIRPTPIPNTREHFWQLFNELGIQEVLKQYAPKGKKEKIIQSIKRFIKNIVRGK